MWWTDEDACHDPCQGIRWPVRTRSRGNRRVHRRRVRRLCHATTTMTVTVRTAAASPVRPPQVSSACAWCRLSPISIPAVTTRSTQTAPSAAALTCWAAGNGCAGWCPQRPRFRHVVVGADSVAVDLPPGCSASWRSGEDSQLPPEVVSGCSSCCCASPLSGSPAVPCLAAASRPAWPGWAAA